MSSGVPLIGDKPFRSFRRALTLRMDDNPVAPNHHPDEAAYPTGKAVLVVGFWILTGIAVFIAIGFVIGIYASSVM